jgi:hypothetical protein
VISYNKKKLKIIQIIRLISPQGTSKTVDQIRKETKIKDGGDSYLFFTTLKNKDFIVISCKKYVNNITR